ncbi:MAG TPA: HD domain-containing protein [Aggregatilineales bacterium]|nr:HD domain-containing protein [Aggregatilineales bacterium]
MSLSEAQRNKIASYVRSYIIRTAERHGHQNATFRANARWMHTLNVRHNLMAILKGEKTPPDVRDVCEVAAFFHDVDHYTVQLEYHAERGAETASRFLTKEGYAPEFVQRVAYIIREHNRDLEDDTPVEQQVQQIISLLNLEARMVMDADTLDKIGASNILQSVASMASSSNRPVAEAARELTSGWPLQRARLWKEMLTTATGQKMGAQRFAFYERFLKQIADEMVMDDPFPEIAQTQEMSALTSS